jgi:hypothetical protein
LTTLHEVIETLQELERMHQLNYELLEQLSVTCRWMTENKIQSPNILTLCSLLSRVDSLLAEMKANSPKTIIYQKLSDGRKHSEESNGEVTVPNIVIYKEGIVSVSTPVQSWKRFIFGREANIAEL